MASVTVPNWAQSLVTKLQEIAPATHVAGGFLRDLDNGVKPKDLDVFVPEDANIREIADVVRKTHSTFGETHLNDPMYDAHTGNIASSREYLDPNGLLEPVNIIQIPGLQDHPFWNIERFDFGICQIAWEPRRGLLKTGNYVRDQEHRDFTLVNCLSTSQAVRAQQRFDRIRPRYKGWRMYVPWKFRELTGDMDEDIF